MSLSALFLTSLLVVTASLLIATKYRWNWKQIFLWPVASLCGLGIVAWIWIYISDSVGTTAQVQHSFWGISLKATKDDVISLKGKPNDLRKSENGNELWFYGDRSALSQQVNWYGVVFVGDRLRLVVYYDGSNSSADALVQGQWWRGKRPEDIIEQFGPPSHASESQHGLNHVLSYSSYNIFFVLESNQVVSYGIYNPSFGPVKFARVSKSSRK